MQSLSQSMLSLLSDTAEGTPVLILTDSHCYRGSLVNRGLRIQDILGESGGEVVELVDAVIESFDPEQDAVQCRCLKLRKESIVFAIPLGPYEAPGHRLARYVRMDCYPAIITTPGAVLSGVAHVPPRVDPSLLLSNASTMANFMGLREVRVHQARHSSMPKTCSAIVLRRQMIEAIELANRLVPTPPRVPGERSSPAETS